MHYNNLMKILFIGDISARPGRSAIKELLPNIKKKNDIDFVIANCENSAGGRGVNANKLNDLMSYGIDFFTAGEHVWSLSDFREYLVEDTFPLVRPYNYEKTEQIPGSGYKEFDLGSNGKMVLITLIGQTFMRENVRNPFWMIDELLSMKREEWREASIIVDFHAEATSEKLTMGNYLRDRVTAVLGTHTHVPTADTRLFGSTAYVTDVGMVGPYDASLWVDFESVTHNFKYPYKKPFQVEFTGRRVFNSVIIDISNTTSDFGVKQSTSIKRIDKLID